MATTPLSHKFLPQLTQRLSISGSINERIKLQLYTTVASLSHLSKIEARELGKISPLKAEGILSS